MRCEPELDEKWLLSDGRNAGKRTLIWEGFEDNFSLSLKREDCKLLLVRRMIGECVGSSEPYGIQ